MIKVLKVFGKLNPGGAEMRTLELIKAINESSENIKFHILALSGEKGTLDSKFVNTNAKIHYIKLKRIDFILKFYKLIKKENFDVLYSNVFLFSGVLVLLGKIFKIPYKVSHIRTLFDEKENKSILRKYRNFILRKLIYYFSDIIIGVNNSVLKSNFKGFDLTSKKFKVLPNGISPSPITKFNQKYDTVNLIHIGRQVPAKNHLKLIKVFNEYEKKNPNCILYLVGDINENINAEIYKVIKANNLNGKVVQTGVLNNINEILIGKNLLIFPSIREGLPGVLLEALSNGVPILASDIDPNIELSNYFSEIYTMPLNESDRKWAEKIDLIIKSNSRVNKLELINEFNKSPFVFKNHLKGYLEILNYSK